VGRHRFKTLGLLDLRWQTGIKKKKKGNPQQPSSRVPAHVKPSNKGSFTIRTGDCDLQGWEDMSGTKNGNPLEKKRAEHLIRGGGGSPNGYKNFVWVVFRNLHVRFTILRSSKMSVIFTTEKNIRGIEAFADCPRT